LEDEKEKIDEKVELVFTQMREDENTKNKDNLIR